LPYLVTGGGKRQKKTEIEDRLIKIWLTCHYFESLSCKRSIP